LLVLYRLVNDRGDCGGRIRDASHALAAVVRALASRRRRDDVAIFATSIAKHARGDVRWRGRTYRSSPGSGGATEA